MPAWEYYEQAGFAICRPNLLFNCFLISCTYNPVYTMYVSHIKRVLWYTRVISPTLAPEAVGDSQSRAHASTKYTTHILIKMICGPSWAISEYYCALIGYIDTLPLELFASWATLPLRLASWATLPLWLLCLLGLPRGLLCLLGHVSLTLSVLTMPVY
jgi:hypothetical protein